MLATSLSAVPVLAASSPADPAFSIYMNVTGWDPQILYTSSWVMKLSTGAIWSDIWVDRDGTKLRSWLLNTVGTHVVPYGHLSDGASSGSGFMSIQRDRASDNAVNTTLLHPDSDVGVLADFPDIPLEPFYVVIDLSYNATLTIDHITLGFPIITKA